MATKDKKTSMKPKESASKAKAGQKSSGMQSGKASGTSTAKSKADEKAPATKLTDSRKISRSIDEDEE